MASSFFNAYKTGNYSLLAEVAEKMRKAISKDDNPPIASLVNTGVVPHIIKLLDYNFFQFDKLISECAWIIANVASSTGKSVAYLMEHGIATRAINLLEHSDNEVKANALWILGNIAGDDLEYRNVLLENDIVNKLIDMLNGGAFPPAFVDTATWLMSNLCRGKPYPPYPVVRKMGLFT